MAKTGSSRTAKLAKYPHHFNHNAPKAKPTFCNPQGKLFVKTAEEVIQTRDNVAEVVSAVAP